MIITIEVLDRPKITFTRTENSLSLPTTRESFKRATSPTLYSDNKKIRSSNTHITTHPIVKGETNSPKIEITTASILMTTPKNYAANVDSLKCDPFEVSAKLCDVNLRVETKESKRGSTPPPSNEVHKKETSEQWLERLHGNRRSFFGTKPGNSQKETTVNQNLGTFQPKLPGNGSSFEADNNYKGKEGNTQRKISVLNFVIGRRKSSVNDDDFVTGKKIVAPDISRNGKSAADLHCKNIGGKIGIPDMLHASSNERNVALGNGIENLNENNGISIKRPKFSVCSESEPKKFRSRCALSASVPPNLRKNARNVNNVVETLSGVRSSHGSSGLNKENQPNKGKCEPKDTSGNRQVDEKSVETNGQRQTSSFFSNNNKLKTKTFDHEKNSSVSNTNKLNEICDNLKGPRGCKVNGHLAEGIVRLDSEESSETKKEKIHEIRSKLKNSNLFTKNPEPNGPEINKSELHEPKKSRNNSLTDAFIRFRRGSASFSNKRGSVGNNKRCSISGCSGKRPSISALQDNKSFIDILRSRKNSLSSEVRTRSNSLTNVVNIRRAGRRAEKKKNASSSLASSLPASERTNRARSSPPQRTAAFADNDWKTIKTKRMGKTTTTTETRTFQKGGKWYQETKETTVVEHKTGTNTSTKVTTKELPGPPKDHASSSSSRSPSPVRSKKASATDCGSKGLLSKLKTKVQDASSSDDEEERDEKLSKQTLVQINKKRTLHGVKALKLSPELNKEAKKWAEQLAKKDAMAHKNDEKFGENIYKLSSNVAITWERICAATPVDNWYDEIKVHKFGQEPQGGKLDSGHFTQLVWKDTKEFGFGTASSKSGLSVYFVAFFSPKGNWMGEFAQQVPPVGGFPKDSLLSNVTSKLQSAVLSSSSSDDEEEDFAEAVLKAHNKYRLKHGVAPLTISKKLNKVAEDWAKTIAKKDRMEHRPNNDYGENIYSKWNSVPNHTISGAEPVDSWYSEIKDHVFGKEPRSMVSGHFTQVVWADSRELGVGMARNKSSGKLYVVCNYNPPGNMVGSYAIKVPAPKS
ncbi:uncharacterized protein LOC108679773 isoform X2 [Hyalella azteca]|uniref:Uncharacterized protein LOC108679773 isoform X1 n=2 Tax=Hyalella azteca TaxID=294128 RepID=A0A8B7PFB8_HYAAZ|nr:uncharacterized protein LOC108679773 isoform X2 [Hyalella azteca]XP_018023984.1 uncharacterized protein LOC108679773 isoform X2 [Hyalella azteca]XP_018023986.1 uncharacterized protein LOC108679773 isoform X1 [Hyalella azteca]XP_047739587.1 uncharacterized protein LOC108679773 isoform X2 [Hyalella azteca]